MREFTQLQNQFQDFLLHTKHDIFEHIVSTDTVSSTVRLAIYGNAYRARLKEALVASYPIIQRYLGSEAFDDLGDEYINAYPSLYRSIRWFGDNLATFLLEHPIYKDQPCLSELAQFEWTCCLVFDSADSSILTIEKMSTVSPDIWTSMRFKIHPSAYRLNLSWNVVAIWQSINAEQAPAAPEQSLSPIPWLLWRTDLTSRFSSLPPDEAWAIDALFNDHTFGEICEGLCQWVDENEAGMRAASLLKGWISAGLIAYIT